jgi:hypothetical protein
MNRIFRIVTIVMLMALTSACAYAQSASEYYIIGRTLMKKGDYSGAIDEFKKSMTVNKSAANVKKCKAQIAICKRHINPKPVAPAAPQKSLVIPHPMLYVAANPENELGVQIDTTPESNDWNATINGNASWLELSKSMDGKYLVVKAEPTDKTIVRSADISVVYDKLTRTVHVAQAGKDVELVPSTLFIKFKKKGGQMLVNINCNSDTIYDNNYNWIIEKAPEWCNAEGTSTNLVLNVDPLVKKDPYYKTGRTGDIILRSQSQECIIRIDQK